MTSVGATLLAAINCFDMDCSSLAYILTTGLLMGVTSHLQTSIAPSARYEIPLIEFNDAIPPWVYCVFALCALL